MNDCFYRWFRCLRGDGWPYAQRAVAKLGTFQPRSFRCLPQGSVSSADFLISFESNGNYGDIFNPSFVQFNIQHFNKMHVEFKNHQLAVRGITTYTFTEHVECRTSLLFSRGTSSSLLNLISDMFLPHIVASLHVSVTEHLWYHTMCEYVVWHRTCLVSAEMKKSNSDSLQEEHSSPSDFCCFLIDSSLYADMCSMTIRPVQNTKIHQTWCSVVVK